MPSAQNVGNWMNGIDAEAVVQQDEEEERDEVRHEAHEVVAADDVAGRCGCGRSRRRSRRRTAACRGPSRRLAGRSVEEPEDETAARTSRSIGLVTPIRADRKTSEAGRSRPARGRRSPRRRTVRRRDFLPMVSPWYPYFSSFCRRGRASNRAIGHVDAERRRPTRIPIATRNEVPSHRSASQPRTPYRNTPETMYPNACQGSPPRGGGVCEMLLSHRAPDNSSEGSVIAHPPPGRPRGRSGRS